MILTLKDCIKLHGGGTPSKAKSAYWGGSIDWLSVKDMKEAKYIDSTIDKITELGVKNSATRIAPSGSIVIATRMAVGRVAILRKDTAINQDVKYLEFKKPIDTEFLFYFLKANQENLERKATGSTVKGIKIGHILDLEIDLPSLTDQKRIAKVLSDCEQLIAWRKESIRLLDEYLESMFLEMFGPENPDFEKWKIDKIESYAFPKKGSMRTGPFGSNLLHSEFQEEGEVKVLGIDNVVNNTFEEGKPRFITDEKYKQLKRYTVFGGDVLISIMATNGRSAVVPDNFPTAINSKHLAAITLNQNLILPFYLKYSFEYHPVIKQQLSKNMKGAIMSGLNLTIIKNLKLPQPPLQEQKHFSNKVKKQRFLIKQLSNSLSELENFYASLSQKAFQGELDLSKVVIEEEAEDSRPLKFRGGTTHKEAPPPDLKKAAKKSKKLRDIRNLSLMDFLEVPDELYAHNAATADYSPDLGFITDDLFYQFYLKDNFPEEAFTFSALEASFNSYYIPKGKDFDPKKWKSILYKFMEGPRPKVEQIFEDDTGTLKLKLTDEAFKA